MQQLANDNDPINQLLVDKIKSRPTLRLVLEARYKKSNFFMQISYLHNRKPIFVSECNIFQAFFSIKSFTTIVNSIFEYVYGLYLLLNDEQT